MNTSTQPTDVTSILQKMQALPEFENAAHKNSFEGFLKKMEQIKSFNDVNKYRVVFIGEPGKGKTTAICNWLGLLKKKRVHEKNIGAISLLATAAGRTTVAEVHIRQISGQSKLRMEYMPVEKQKEYIREYCRYYYSVCFGIEEDTVDDNKEEISIAANVHIEIDRVIRNMAKLENPPTAANEKAIIKKQEIMSFMRQFPDENSFFEYVISKIDLKNRNCKEITYNSIEAFEIWLSRTFKEVNDGKRDDCSIASKVYVDVSQEDLPLGMPENVSEVIDTIGLDSSVRTDLQDLMLAKDTICFLMDDLKSVPSANIRSLIKGTYLNNWDSYCIDKTSIFVKSPESDLAAVNEAEGDPEYGRELKLNELERRTVADGLPYNIINTLFLDSCAAYIMKSERILATDENGKPVINPKTGRQKVRIVKVIDRYENEVALEYQQSVSEKVQMIINSLKSKLEEDASNIQEEVLKLVELENMKNDSDSELELENLKSELKEKRQTLLPRFREKDVSNAILTKAIDNIHWATIRKMNSLCGGYNRWHTDIYTQIMQAGRECFSSVSKPVTAQIREMVISIKNDDARSIVNGYMNQYDSMVKESTERIGQKYLSWALNEGFAPRTFENPFWREVIEIRGTGFKRRVRNKYEDHIYDELGMLAKMITSEMDRIIDVLIDMF